MKKEGYSALHAVVECVVMYYSKAHTKGGGDDCRRGDDGGDRGVDEPGVCIGAHRSECSAADGNQRRPRQHAVC